MYCNKCQQQHDGQGDLCNECEELEYQKRQVRNSYGIVGFLCSVVSLLAALVACYFAESGIKEALVGADLLAVGMLFAGLVCGVQSIKAFARAIRLKVKKPVFGLVLGIFAIVVTMATTVFVLSAIAIFLSGWVL
jgi:hypothetical protein